MSKFLSIFAEAVDDGYGGTIYDLTDFGFTVLVVLAVALLILGVSVFGGKEKFSTKKMAFSSMAIALAVITSYAKLYSFPMGGSITLFSMLFVVLVGYWYGLRTGIMVAITYGLVQLIVDPYIISIPQMLIDYIFAFGALGLSGLFCNRKHGLVLGYITGILGRYVFAFLSGWIFFGQYAADWGMSAPVYSAVYNIIYIAAEGAITIIVISIPAVSKALEHVKNEAIS